MSAERAAQLIDAGIWLKLSGDLEGARRLFERALKLDPENARARELLAQGPAEVAPTAPVSPAPAADNPFERQSSTSAVDGDWGAAMGGDPAGEVPWAQPEDLGPPALGSEPPGRTMMMFSAPAIEPATPSPPADLAGTPFAAPGQGDAPLDDLPLATPTTPFAMHAEGAAAPPAEVPLAMPTVPFAMPAQSVSAPVPEANLDANWGQIAAPGEALQEPLAFAPPPAITPAGPQRSTMVYSGTPSGSEFQPTPAQPRSTMVFSAPSGPPPPRITMMFTTSPVPVAAPVEPARSPTGTLVFSQSPVPEAPARSTMVFSATTAGPMAASATPEVQAPMVIAIRPDDNVEEPISIVDSLRSQVDAARARPPAAMKAAPPAPSPSFPSSSAPGSLGPVPSPPQPTFTAARPPDLLAPVPSPPQPMFIAPSPPDLMAPMPSPFPPTSGSTMPAATVVLTDRKPEPTLPAPTPPMFAEGDLLPPMPKTAEPSTGRALPADDAWNWSSSQPALSPRPSPALTAEASSAWDQRSNPGIKIEDLASSPSKALEFVSSSSRITKPPEVSKADEVALLLRGARDLIDLDDHTGAMELIVKAEALAPDAPEVIALRERSEKTLLAMFESKLGHLDKLPRVLLKDDEIIWLNLDHRAGFVLAQIDGSVTFEDLFEVSGMTRIDTARILAQLVDEGVISRG